MGGLKGYDGSKSWDMKGLKAHGEHAWGLSMRGGRNMDGGSSIGPPVPDGAVLQAPRPPSTPSMSNLRRPGVSVYAWGRGDFGQLGFAVDSYMAKPQKVDGLHGKDVIHIAGNEFNSSFVTEDGELYAAGNNDFGQLGCRGRQAPLDAGPMRVEALDLYKVRHSASGQNHTLAVTDQGLLASWGAGEFGQLGQGGEGVDQPQPRIIKGSKELGRFARVAAGACHSLGLTKSGHVHSWGQLWPVGIVQVSCGENHSAALSIDGRVFTWGRGKYGQLGLGSFQNVSSPCQVRALASAHASQASACGSHLMVVLKDVWEGERVVVGPDPYRRKHGAGMVPIYLPHILDLCEAASKESSAKAVAVQELISAVEDVFGSAGFLASGFSMPDSTNSLSSRSAMQKWQRTWGPVAFYFKFKPSFKFKPWSPAQAILTVDDAEAILKVYDADVIAALGGSCCKLLSGIENVLRKCAVSAAGAAASAAHAHVRQSMGPRGVDGVDDVGLSSMELLPAIFVLFLSPLNGEATGMGVQLMFRLMSVLLMLPLDLRQLLAKWLIELPVEIVGGRVLRPIQRYLNNLVEFGFEAKRADILRAAQLLDLLYDANEKAPSQAKPKTTSLEAASVPQSRTHARINLSEFYNSRVSNAANLREEYIAYADTHSPGAAVKLAYADTHSPGAAVKLAYADTHSPGAAVKLAYDDTHSPGAAVKLAYADTHSPGAAVKLAYADTHSPGAAVKLAYADTHSPGAAVKLAYADKSSGSSIEAGGYADKSSGSSSETGVTSLCQVPFLLTPEAKSRILQGEASVQKQQIVQNSALSAIFQGIHPVTVAFLDISIRRTSILQDCLEQIVKRPGDLKKPLRVTFIQDGVAEEGLDEGGVSREFFQLLVLELFCEDYGMFTYYEETRDFWFNSSSLESSVEFQLVGIILGLAIYNGVILDIHFPLVVYKKLLGEQPTFDDLAEAQPSLAKGLQQLLDFNGDVENTFCSTFSVEVDFFGEKQTQDLMPGGRDVPVTAENRQKYVTLYTQWLLVKSIEKQFNAFAHGFHQVCGGLALSLFRYDELELLVCGLPHLDFHELEKNARYEGGYDANHTSIVSFWSIVHAMSIDQKRRLLAFSTGCDRVPIVAPLVTGSAPLVTGPLGDCPLAVRLLPPCPEQGQSAKLSSGGIRHGERGAKDRRSGHAEKDGGIDKAMHLDSHKSGHQHSSSPTDGQDGKEKKEGWAKAGDQEDVRSRGEGHTDSNAEQERRRRRSLSRSMGKSKGRNGDKHSEERWSSKRSRTEEDNAKEETLEPESRPQSSSGGSRERRRSSDSVSHRASDPPAPTGLASNSHKRGYGGAHSHARAPDGPGGRRSSDSGKERRGSMDAQEQAAVGNGKSRNNGIASERQEEDHMVADSDRKASDSAAIASKPSPPRAAAPAGPKAAAAATGGASTSKPSPPSTAAPAGPKAAVAAAGGVVASKQRRLLSFEDEEDGGEDAGTKFSLSASTSSRFQKERASRPLTSAIDVSASLVSWTPSRLASALGATPVAASAAGGGPSAVRPSNRITLGGEADAEMPRSASISGQGKMLGHMVYGVATARNVRPYMEDRHTVVQSLRPLSITGQPINDGVERSFASVYDGHNGSRSAEPIQL
eukprot:gene14653-20687_t